MEIEGFGTTRDELTKLIPELQAQCFLSDSDAAKLVELEAQVEKCKSDMSSCEASAAELEAEVAELQQAILDAGGPELKKQQQLCDKILADLNKTEKELSSAKVAITSSEKAAAKAREAQAVAEEQVEECKQNMEEKKAERKTLEEDAFNVMQSFESVKATEAAKRQALEAFTKECEDLEKSLSDEKVVEVELSGKLEACEKQLSECEKRKKSLVNSIDKLRADIEEDEMDLSDDEDEDDDDDSRSLSSGSKDAPDSDDKSKSLDTVMRDSDEEGHTSQPPKSKSSLPTLSYATLEKYSKEDILNEINVLETERNTIAKNANMGAIAEYRKKEADYLARYVSLKLQASIFLLRPRRCTTY